MRVRRTNRFYAWWQPDPTNFESGLSNYEIGYRLHSQARVLPIKSRDVLRK